MSGNQNSQNNQAPSPTTLGGTTLTKDQELEQLLDPTKIAETISNRVKLGYNMGKIREEVISVDEAFGEVIKTMGRGVELSEVIKESLAQGAIEILELGGDLKDAQTIQEELMSSTSKNLIATAGEIKDIFAVTDVLGTSFSTINSGLLDAGMSMKDVSMYGVTVLETSKKLGVNAQVVSTLVAQNMNLLNRYGFEKGIEGLSKMAAKASAMRVDMTTITGLADKLLNPEKSIEFSNTLNMLGITATNLTNPLASMNLAQNNVGALTDELGSALETFVEFNEETKSFEIPPFGREMFREFSEQTGMQIDQIEKLAISYKKTQRVIDETDFGAFKDLDPDIQQTIGNLAQIDKEGNYTITTEFGKENLDDFLARMGGDSEKLTEAIQGIKAEEDKSYEDKMLEYNQKQMTYTEKMYNALVGIEEKPQKLFAKSDLAEAQLAGTEKVVQVGKEAADIPYEALNTTMSNSDTMADFYSGFAVNVTKAIEDGAKEFTTKGGKAIADAQEFTKQQLRRTQGQDTLKYPGGEVEYFKEDTIISLTNGPEFIQGLNKINDTISKVPQTQNFANNEIEMPNFEQIFSKINSSINEVSNSISNIETPQITLTNSNKFNDNDFDKLRETLSNITINEQNVTDTVPFNFNKSLNDALNLIQNSFTENLPKATPPEPITTQENFKQITEQVQKIINESTSNVNKVEKKENKITVDVNLNTNGVNADLLKNALNNKGWLEQLRQGITNSVYNDNTDVAMSNIENRSIF